MKSEEIRKTFLKYFEDKGHKIMPSASLIPSDPTVLLTLAGMLPFKPIFLGTEKPKFKRAASAQKCVRMNDIENVGKTSRHHTFFEMLGNFSFGDYFKEDAIAFAWELLTKIFALPEEKLVVAVYEKDDEAADIWTNKYKIPKEKLYRLSEENNFWAAGPTGPCGPCSEIYYDYGPGKGCGKPGCDPSCDCERWLEVWNLVFIQYNRDEAGKLTPLPSKNIDTGMGLERIARLLQNAETNFDTDLFVPIIEKLPKGELISRRIVADHLRAAVYLIADSVLPGNEGRNYVLRRIIRRAVLHGRKLGIKEIFLPKLAETVIEIGRSIYPELSAKSKNIIQTLKTEEESFYLTLDTGMKLLQEMIAKHGKLIPGEEAFKLHDTYGFPVEMTREIVREKGASIDEAGYKAAMEAQRARAREASFVNEEAKIDVSKYPKTNFIGYDKNECDTKVIAILKDEKAVILEKTPFYPAGGGQVGDTGIISFDNKEIIATNTFGEIGGVILHKVDRIDEVKEKQNVKARIDVSRRAATAAHHTATHLLHAALRSVLGADATQAGSLVAPDHFRFDFHSPKALNACDIEEIEKQVNENIKKKIKVEISEMSIDDAKKLGAMALFGEKYGNRVRVVRIPAVSIELCGGCHIKNTEDISFFKIVKEEALQAGIRRIEAVAGSAAKIYVIYQGKGLRDSIYKLIHELRLLQDEKEKLGNKEVFESNIFEIDQEELVRLTKAVDNVDIVNVNKFLEHLRGRVEWLKERKHTLLKEIEKFKEKKVLGQADALIAEIKEINGVKVLAKEFENISMSNLRSLADEVKSKMPSGILIFSAANEGKASFLVIVSDDLTAKYNAGKMAKALAETCGGGGGGKASKAEAGGRDISKIKEAFDKVLGAI
ncbi:MAG: alanine--tRNA ligase [Candidatus Margulisiibacteriota bacterium]